MAWVKGACHAGLVTKSNSRSPWKGRREPTPQKEMTFNKCQHVQVYIPRARISPVGPFVSSHFLWCLLPQASALQAPNHVQTLSSFNYSTSAIGILKSALVVT